MRVSYDSAGRDGMATRIAALSFLYRRYCLMGVAAFALITAGSVSVTQAQVQLFPAPSQTETTPSQSNTSQSGKLRAPSGMAVETLDQVDAESIGALPNAERPLPSTLWDGLTRESVAALVDSMPGTGDFPESRDLARRLLLSAAVVPPPEGSQPVSLLSARVEALLRLGFARDARSLAEAGADTLAETGGRRALAQAQLADDDLPGACGTAGTAVAVASEDVFWQKLLAFCQAVAGQTDQAALGAQTLQDTGVKDDLYFALMESLTLNLAPERRPMAAAGPLHAAMLKLTGAPVPPDSSDPLIALLAVGQSDDLAAAEHAARRGILPFASLAEKYQAVVFKDTALDAPFEALDNLDPATARALLYQVVQRWEIPALKAEAVSVALERARQDGVLIAAAPVFARAAMDIPPSSDLLWFAEDAARLFYVTGPVDMARAWHGLLRAAATTDPNAAASDSRLWHLAMLSGETGSDLGQSRRGWDDAVIAGFQDQTAGSAYLALLKALVQAATGGQTLSGESALRRDAMAALPETGIGASALTLHLLDRAAADERVGEVAALAVAALAAGPAQDLNPSTSVAAIRALATVGLREESRQLALEVAILSSPAPVPLER